MMRWFGYVIGCFVAGVVALNLYFLAAIASWQVFNPCLLYTSDAADE